MSIQLIIDDIIYPEACGSEGSYRCYEEPLSFSEEMISGRIIEEVRGIVDIIEYSYKYLDDDTLKLCLQSLKRKRKSSVAYLRNGETELITSEFICTSFTNPIYLGYIDGKVYWTNIGFTLREVKPHA